jgi:hypothetical protein
MAGDSRSVFPRIFQGVALIAAFVVFSDVRLMRELGVA